MVVAYGCDFIPKWFWFVQMSPCKPQVTLLLVSTQTRLFMHYPSIELSLCKVCWTVERCTMTPSAARCSWSSLEVVCGLSVTILTILHLCLSDIFLDLPHLSFTRTVTVAFHFLTTFLAVETDTSNLFDNFLYPSPNSYWRIILVFRSLESSFEISILQNSSLRMITFSFLNLLPFCRLKYKCVVYMTAFSKSIFINVIDHWSVIISCDIVIATATHQ